MRAVSLALLLAGCSGPLDRVRTPEEAPPEVSGPREAPGRVQVRSDPRVDLGYTLVALAHDGDLIVDDEAPVTRAAREELLAFRAHPAVRRVPALERSGLWAYPLVHALLAFTPPPALEPRGPIPEDVLARLPGDTDAERRQALDAWIADVRDFARRSRFDEFLARHDAERRAQVDAVLEALDDLRPVALMETYCGGKGFDQYLVHPSAFTRAEYGYGPSVETDDQRIAFHLAGRAVTQERGEIMHLLLHELGHSFVHEALDVHPGEVARREQAFADVSPFMGAYYPTWRIALGEQMVEAVTARLMRNLFGPRAAENVLVLADESRGYGHVEPLARALRDYERRRDAYPAIGAFVPEALKALDRAAGRPRLYGGADGIDRNRAVEMARRVARAALRNDPTLLEDHVARGFMRGSLLYELTRLLPQQMGMAAGDSLEARVRTVRRVRADVTGGPPRGPSSGGLDALVATADLRAGNGDGARRALLRLTLQRDPARIIAAGWELQERPAGG